MTFELRELSSHAIERLLESNPDRRAGIIIPAGAVEQHGPVLPVTCDVDIAEGAALALARALWEHPRYLALVAPAVAYGPVPGGEETHGTSAVSFDALGGYLKEVVGGFARSGRWAFIAVLNGHGHNHGRVIEASSATYRSHRIPVLAIQLYEFASASSEFGLTAGSHAGEFELAAYAHYTGRTLENPELPADPRPRPRPSSVFGLDLLPRSFSGVVAPEPPSYANAMQAAQGLGRRLDALVAAKAIADLDLYFTHWTGAPQA